MYLLTRRTLKCAAFACPLAFVSPWLSALCQMLFTAYAAAFLPVTAPLWKRRQESPAVLARRVLFPCAAALFLGYFPRFLLMVFFPAMHILTQRVLSVLAAATAILLQCWFLRFFPYERREHKYLTCVCLVFFIACMLSAG